ncbi:MAG TPA: hypothetical protein VF104_12450 [Burkholderiales bacterium]
MTDPLVPPLAPLEAADLLRRAAPDIAHDLNNLRAIVQGNLRFVKQDAKAAGRNDMAEPLADVDLAFQAVVSLTQGILALVREPPVRAPAAQPLQVVLRKVEALARWALPPQFRIAVSAPARETMVLSDPDALPVALYRLALYAKDAAPGGGEVLFAVSEAPPGDAGGNPPPSGREHRHAQICVTIPGKEPGAEDGGDSSGRSKAALRFELALALARRAAAHGGEVRCGSTPKGCSSVCLLLPLATPEAEV